MSARSLRQSIILAAVATSAVIAAAGATPPVNMQDGSLALKGYDAVAYAAAGMPVKGNTQFQHRWNGARWRFSSAENRDRFAREPEKYAPQFGGYCAYAVSRGYTADIDPHAWHIVDGRLYLSYSKRVRRLWVRDVQGNIAKGQANWPAVLNQ
jgi:YHS domain-containing protein